MPRVLYSFPYRIGQSGICSTAWHQVEGAARAGSQIIVLCSSIGRPLPSEVNFHTTLAIGSVRLPLRYLGRARSCLLHDWIVARWLERNHQQVDLIHGWPLSSLHTIRAAKRFGIPSIIERPNTHTAFAYQATAEECKKVGIELPPGHDHEFNSNALDHEIMEYDESDFLLCPSDFVARTFRERGFNDNRLLLHRYGFDRDRFVPGNQDPMRDSGLIMVFVGSCEPRKGLHYALRAWLESGAQHRGRFLICGTFVPGFAEELRSMLEHPSVEFLGQREDVHDLLQGSDLLVLPSVEEGSALVTYEARASGCVLLVSEAAGAVCGHMKDAMVHKVGDYQALTRHISLMDQDRTLLRRLRSNSLATACDISWDAAGICLSRIYSSVADGEAGNDTVPYQ